MRRSLVCATITRGCTLILLGLGGHSGAPAQTATFQNIYDKIGKGSEEKSTMTDQAAKAACSINAALAAVTSGDQKGFASRIDDTLAAFNVVAKTIDVELKKQRYNKKVSLEKWQNVTDLDLSGVVTQRDLLIRLLTIVKEAQTALSRLRSNIGSEEDLVLAIGLAGKISRMLTVYLTTA
jgi:hypothetical protein